MDKIYRRARHFATTKRSQYFQSIGKQQVKDDDEVDKQNDDKNNNKQEIYKKNEKKNNTNCDASTAPTAAGLYDCLTPATRSRLNTLSQIGEDWLYLALLGIIMALLSLSMDSVITLFLGTRIWLSEEARNQNLALQYLAWCMTPILLVTFSTGFVHLCSPTAIGSGIPEMKTILRGVVLNEYLTFRTLVAKIVGLTFTLGSGLPLGKEGPSVHMASIVATLLSKLVASFQGIYENESRTSEMLSAACAVGVAATFYAPIGGVLFSIEVTTVYFAVRNYWRGFFAACCGATIWRLLGFYIQNDESVSAIFKTNFATDYPFEPVELLVFSFIGATCGLAGAAYIKFHREIVQFFRRHKQVSGFLQQNRFVYPTLVTLIITTSTFPPLLGQYTASTLSTHTTIEHLFSNRTWSLGAQDLISKRILDEWTTPNTNFYLHLILYILMLFWTSALASTIPTPSGVFIPVVKMGAAYGRLIGELMAATYPHGIKYSHPALIVPGSYAVVGAAAFSGAVTHTVSTSVILFEMTGQIVHIIPVILGVLISNAVCQSLQPSIYDSIIEIKKLPYLPPIASSNSISHRILVKDFMNRNIPYVCKERSTYAHLKSLLSTHRKIISFPLVESPHTMKLLGSVARPDLLKLLYLHLGRERRLQEVCRRNSDTLAPALHLLSTISGRLVNEQSPPPLVPTVQLTPPVDTVTGSEIDNSFRVHSTDTQNEGSNGQLAVVRQHEQISRKNAGDVSTSLSSSSGDDCESATRLIISASNYQSPHHNYGATESATPSEGQLLNDCQKGLLAHEQMEYKQFHGVAKLVNRYDQGSTMDEDQLDKSIQEVEDHLAKVTLDQKPAEIVVVVSSSSSSSSQVNCTDGQPTSGGAIFKTNSDSSLSSNGGGEIKTTTTNQAVGVIKSLPIPITTPTTPKMTKEMELKQAASFSHVPSSPSLSSRPTKSILKTSSFSNNNNHLNKRMITPSLSFNNYTTPATTTISHDYHNHNHTKAMNNIKFTLAPPNNSEHLTKLNNHSFILDSSGALDSQSFDLEQQTRARRRKVRLPRLRVVDMTPEEQEQWEKEQLNAFIDITKCQIDEAPFQLVEQTSLYRVHTLFSMLGLNHAYVTSFGRLVGIVALKDIRRAIEKMLQEK